MWKWLIVMLGAGSAAAQTTPPAPQAGRATAGMGVSVIVVEPAKAPASPQAGK